MRKEYESQKKTHHEQYAHQGESQLYATELVHRACEYEEHDCNKDVFDKLYNRMVKRCGTYKYRQDGHQSTVNCTENRRPLIHGCLLDLSLVERQKDCHPIQKQIHL